MEVEELQRRLIYSVIVAGKSAKFTDGAMERLLKGFRIAPFDEVRRLIDCHQLGKRLRDARTGNYTKLERALKELVAANLDLTTCNVEDLEKIHGIGQKTSRFFLLWTRPGVRYAALDVHVLRWLRANGLDAPKTTPSSPAIYAFWEKKFLELCDKLKVSARDLDASIWSSATGIY